jgi:Polyketide synthase modules and related proteins
MDSVTGVFGGIWASDYTAVLSKRGAAGRGPFAVAATGCAMLVGRLSYVLGMQGPSIAFDTACSSSLSAFQAALHSHKQQECDAALVLGVNIMCDVGMSQHFAAARMCSPTGRSHTFDALADGYARGEACCGAALVPRAGVQLIRCDAGAVRQDGRSASLTAPNGTAQQALIRAALQSAGRAARGAFILESHGTGTTLGDPIESRAMCAVRDEPELMQVTGCKANFGHTEPAAGITGLLRAGMALLWSVACPNAQLRVMNPHVRRPSRAGLLCRFKASCRNHRRQVGRASAR